jgi:2-(1,2-epoxy-1,2-dihydrophenyl)acetyl-CoA isomerase
VTTVLTDVADGVATITLNRPERLNALDLETRSALLAAVRDLSARDEVRAVVLTGAGRAFCVGQDLRREEELVDAYETVALSYNPIALEIARSPKPFVAAVNGLAVGAGMALALLCDLVVMAEGTSLACSFGKVGLVPDTGASWILARQLGHRRAFEIAVSGRSVPAAEALALGLVNRVVPGEVLSETVTDITRSLTSASPHAVALTKRLLLAGSGQPLEDVVEMEALSQGRAAATEAHAELRRAFTSR